MSIAVVPALVVEHNNDPGVPPGTITLRFKEEVPAELGEFLEMVMGPVYKYEAITPALLCSMEGKCYMLMRELVEQRILWQDHFYPRKWRLDERKLFQWAVRMTIRGWTIEGIRAWEVEDLKVLHRKANKDE